MTSRFFFSYSGGNLLRTSPVNETVTEGASVTLQCESKIATSVVTWYKDDIPISNLTEFRDKVVILPEGSLNIISAGMADSGYYSCEISNDEGRKQSAGAYLNVQCK